MSYGSARASGDPRMVRTILPVAEKIHPPTVQGKSGTDWGGVGHKKSGVSRLLAGYY